MAGTFSLSEPTIDPPPTTPGGRVPLTGAQKQALQAGRGVGGGGGGAWWSGCPDTYVSRHALISLRRTSGHKCNSDDVRLRPLHGLNLRVMTRPQTAPLQGLMVSWGSNDPLPPTPHTMTKPTPIHTGKGDPNIFLLICAVVFGDV